ncbi:MAG TPA: Fe-S protein assembly co-chaperone HscB [Candidatus Margulisiibacteriota bacterium]|nr:Fe-S protein assembly co-chaperone HscB [Candidatus Margulisiibacteriota bacterium]
MWPAGEPLSCWQCGADRASNLFCPRCAAIQPIPDGADYFQVLGVPRRLLQDRDALHQRFYELHRQWHPDRYQTGPQGARSASLRNTAAVNRAYSTLRDPVGRGEYWLTLQGETLGAKNNRVPPELAELVFEVQEKLDELRAARGGKSAADLQREVAEVHAELLRGQAALLEQLDENFRRWDAGAAEPATLKRELKTTLSALAYLRRLIHDVEKELEA